ncbi:carboxypeptidase regulatory-like domain-containing protein [Sporosarcina sp. GW1-11]|uniref:carboxypeptidase regulatory-like domain-containing protein n=1 Tax=Sporosarcina sp. GW1-11 TaxID=2899126 RepID=UPI00294CB81A|nr:carboxypeptidase regulatory-like domain-containing protein [Sporosarcina sp. GW1-11]MDV6378768.1 carboxypeptidase regulatory-like domain-containing protein [Sporosarcina sp. GW1-11]
MKKYTMIQKTITMFMAALLLMYIPLSAGSLWMKEASATSIYVPPITEKYISHITADKRHDKGDYYYYKVDAEVGSNVFSAKLFLGKNVYAIPIAAGKTSFEEFIAEDLSRGVLAVYDSNNNFIEEKAFSIGSQKNVEIPNSALKGAILEELGKQTDANITEADMLELVNLDASFRQIDDLTGLEYALNLQTLDLESNQLLGNQLALIEKLPKLEILLLANNKLGNQAISYLSSMNSLRTLDLNNTGISTIDSLAQLRDLEELYAGDNLISQVKNQLYFGKLRELNLNNNQLTSAHFISSKYYPALIWIDFRANKLACESSEWALQDLKNHQVNVQHDPMNCKQTVNVEISFEGNSQELIDAVQSISLYSYNARVQSNWQQGSFYQYNPKIVNGKFLIQNVPFADDYHLSVYSSKFVDYNAQPIQITANTSTIAVTLEKGVRITGRVTDAQVNPLIGANVYAQTWNTLNQYPTKYTQSGSGGFFDVTGVTKGNGELQAYFPGYENFKMKLNIPANDVYDVGTIYMQKEKYVQGRVMAADGKTPVKNADVSLESSTHYGWSYTDSDGYFYIRNVQDQNYTLRITDYSGVHVALVQSNVTPKPEPYQFIMQKPQKGNFTGVGNSFVASDETAIPGKVINYRLNYRNNGQVQANQAQLAVTIPNELELDPQSVRLDGKKVSLNSAGQVTIQNVKPGKQGRLSFSAKVKNVTVPAISTSGRVIENGVTSWTSAVTTNVLFVTLEAPQVTSTLDFKVYGKAKPGATVKIYNEDLLLAETVANSRLWYTDVKLVGDVAEKRSFPLHAVVEENNQVYKSEEIIVMLDASVPKITSASIDASYNKNIKLNPYTGIASAGVFVNPYRSIPADPIDVRLQFNQDIDQAKLKFMDRVYPLSKTTAGYNATIKGDWLSYGDQLIEVEFTKNGQSITLPLMQVIVLIDPSGYVFEGSMENRLTDVEAVVEEKKDNVWSQWNAEMFGQINPQKTDSEGRYGWDVPAGDWRVKFSKQGYVPYISRTVTVPPPEMDLNIPLKATTAASVMTLEANEKAVKVIFDRPVLEKDLSQYIQVVHSKTKEIVKGTFTLQHWNGYKEVAGQSGYYEEDETVKLSKEVNWTPDASLAAGTLYNVVVKKELKDYAGQELATGKSTTFSTATDESDDEVAQTPPGDWGEIIEKPEAVGKDKVWTIKLSKPVDSTTLKSSIFLTDKKGFPVTVKLTVENDGEYIVVTPPNDGYSTGKYHLMIMDNLKDQNGTSLKMSVLMPFTVK